MTTSTATARDAIERVMRDWDSAVAAADPERLGDLVADDVTFLLPRAEAIRGRAAMVAMYRGLFAQHEVRQVFRAEQIEVAGAWAFLWGTDEVALVERASGQLTERASGYGMVILCSDAGGRWRVSHGINNLARERERDAG